MNKEKSKIDKLREFFKATPGLENLEVIEKKAEESTKEKFEEVTLADGIVVNVEPALEAGATITTELDGVIIKAPVGEHPLSDGRLVVVVEEGIISEIKEVEGEPETEEAIEEEMGTDETITPQAKKVIESIVKEHIFKAVEPVQKENEFLHKEIEFLKAQSTELKENTGVALEELSAVPTKEPIKKKENAFAKKDKTFFGVTIKH